MMLRKRPVTGPVKRNRQRVRLFEQLECRRLLTTTLFSDNFESGSLNNALWPSYSPATARAAVFADGNGPIGAPGTYAAGIFGSDGVSSRGMQSKTISLSGYANAKLSFRVEAAGSENSPESSEDLIVDYRTSNGSWVNLMTIDQSSVNHSSFSTVTETLPSAALHSSMSFRIYATGLDYDTIGSCGSFFGCFKLPADFWFVDDVSLIGSRPPTVTTTVPSAGKDSSDHTLSWSVSDPDNDTISSVSTQLFRGSSLLRSSTAQNGALKVLKSDGPGTYKLQVTATDSTGAKRIQTSTNLVVTDDDTKAPTITISGSSGTQNAANNQQFTWSIIDDLSGSTSSVVITKDGNEIFSRDYTSDVTSDTFDFNAYGVGSFVISVNATDKDNDRANDASLSTAVRSVNVDNGAPAANMQVLASGTPVYEGDEIQFDASLSSDPEGDALQYVWNFGDATLARGANAKHRYADDGVYVVTLTVVDTFGGLSTASQSLTIENAHPVLTASSPPNVAEASSFVLNLAAADPGTDSTSYLVQWGDGTSNSYSTAGEKQHIYTDGGLQHTLRVALSDEDGVYADQYVAQVTVDNVAPSVDGFPQFVSAEVNQVNDWIVSVSDGLSDTHTYTWDFGDGAVESGADLAAVQHAYSSEGAYTLTLTVADSDGFSTQKSATVVIGAPVSFVGAGQTVNESTGAVVIEAELTNGVPLDHDVIVTLAIAGDVSEADYEFSSAQIVIPQGQLTGSTSIDVFDDALDENNESLRIVMASTSGASRGAVSEYVIEIQDDDAMPLVYFTSQSQIVDESLGTTRLVAKLSRTSGRDVMIPISFTGLATLGADYAIAGPATITIPAGETSGELEVIILDDNSIEKSESIVATMLPSQQAILSSQVGHVSVVSTIIAANDAPDVSLDSAYRVTTEDTSTFFITARLSHFSDERITVPLAISGTAQNGVDYRIVKAVLEFLPGSAEASIQINIVDDSIAEGVETLVVELLSATNANLGTTQITVTDILDNDIARVSFEAGNISEFEGHTVPITVRLSKVSATNVVIPLMLSGSAGLNSDYSLSNSTLVVPAGTQQMTFDVTLLDDTRNEVAETLFLQLSESTTGALLGNFVTKKITIKDTDPFVTLIAPSASRFLEQNTSVTLRVELSAPTDEAITVPIKFSGTAKRGSDFNASTSVMIPKGEKSRSFSVSLIDDANAESNESVVIVLGTPSAGTLANPKKASFSIDDNDAPVTVFWKSRYVSTEESSGSQTFTIGLTRPATQDVTVKLAYASEGRTVSYQKNILGRTYGFSYVTGVAEVGSDYEASVKSVVIRKGDTSVDFVVPVIDDFVKEGAEIIKIRLKSASNALLPVDQALREATFTITDIDRLTSSEVQAMDANLAQSNPQDLLGLDVQPLFVANFDNERAQEDALGALLFAVEEGTKFIPGPAGCIAQGVAHAIKWTQEQYPNGTELDYDRLQEDMNKGIYWKILARELAFFYTKGAAWAAATGGSTCEEPAEFSWLTQLGSAALEAYLDSYDPKAHAEAAGEALGDEYTKFHKANDDGYVEFKEDPQGSFEGGIDYYIGSKIYGGYVSNGTVFFDTDFNRVHSSLEPIGSTASNGQVVVVGLATADIDGNGMLDLDEGQWVGTGGTDTSVNQPLQIPLVAPAHYSNITPTSTLIAAMLNSGRFEQTTEGLQAVEQRFFDAIGLPAFQLGNFDFLEEAAQGDVSAATLFAKETQFYNTVMALATLFDASGSGLPFDHLASLVFDDLADKISSPGSSLNLANSAMVQSVIQGVSIRSGIEIDSDSVAAIATVLARSNQIVDDATPEGSKAYLEAIVQSHAFVQSSLVLEIADLIRGNSTIATFNANNSDLTSRVQGSPTFDILPVHLVVEDATATEGSNGSPSVVTFTVTPLGTSVHPVSVNFATEDRSAVAGDDYQSVAGTLNWAPGDDSPRTVSITLNADNQFESNEAFALLLSNAQNATILAPQAHGHIENDDIFELVSPSEATDQLVISISNSALIVEQNGEIVYDERAEQGALIRISGQIEDSVVITNSAVSPTEIAVDQFGARTLSIGNHVVQLDGDIALNPSQFAGDVGLPEFIFAETMLSLSATVPEYLDADALVYQWRIFRQGETTPAIGGNASTFSFTPDEEHVRVELSVSDGLSSAAIKQEIHVYPPNVAPVAHDDATTSTENSVASTDVIANDLDLNPDDSLSLVPGSVVIRTAQLGVDGATIALQTATAGEHTNSIVFDPGTDFEFLGAGEQATVVIEYEVTDDNLLPLSDVGSLTITVVGLNDMPRIEVDSIDINVYDGVTVRNSVTFSEVDETDVLTSSVAKKSEVTSSTAAIPVALSAALDGAVTLVQTGSNDGTIDWAFTLDNSLVQYLAAGETVTATYSITVDDNSGTTNATATQDVTVTINGINDQPTMGVVHVVGAVTEDDSTPNLSDTGSVTFSEVDETDVLTSSVAKKSEVTSSTAAIPVALSAALDGAVTLVQTGSNDGTIDWAFTLDNSLVQYLAAGETVTATYTITVDDNSGTTNATVTQDVMITINGVNDLPIIDELKSWHESVESRAKVDVPVFIDGRFHEVDISDGHLVTVDWGEVPGNSDSETFNPTGVEPSTTGTFAKSHIYAEGGIYTVTLTVDDLNGGVVSQTTTIVIAGVGLVDGTLYVIGTDGKDKVDVKLKGSVGGADNRINVKGEFDNKGDKEKFDIDYPAGSVTDIVVILIGDDDDAHVHQDVFVDAFIDGGDGDDKLKGGSGNDTILGGAGEDDIKGYDGNDLLDGGDDNDRIHGGKGSDILLGGAGDDDLNAGGDGGSDGASVGVGDILSGGDGDDKLEGSKGMDILIGGLGADDIKGGGSGVGGDLFVGGTTEHDDAPEALLQIQAIWTSNNSLANKTNALTAGGALLDNVSGDGKKDKLKGHKKSVDLFFAKLGLDSLKEDDDEDGYVWL